MILLLFFVILFILFSSFCCFYILYKTQGWWCCLYCPPKRSSFKNKFIKTDFFEDNAPIDIIIPMKDDVYIHCYFFYKEERKNTIIFFHGNASNIFTDINIIKRFVSIVECNIFYVDYRGYGENYGNPTMKNLISDGKTIIDYLYNDELSKNQTYYFLGNSLGGALLIHLISHLKFYENKVGGIIIQNVFTCMSDMIIEKVIRDCILGTCLYLCCPKKDSFNLIQSDDTIKNMIEYFSTERWNNMRVIKEESKNISFKCLFIISKKDHTIPRGMVHSLCNEWWNNETKEVFEINANHNNIFSTKKHKKIYYYRIKKFLRDND